MPQPASWIRRRPAAWVLASCLVAGPAAQAADMPAGVSAPVVADTPEKTPGGVTFTLAKGWRLNAESSVLRLEPPEADTRIAMVDVESAPDAASAAAKAWTLYRPDAHRVVKLVSPQPAGDGWDERASIDYVTAPNERAFVLAFALRKGTHWTVAIVDGSQATVEKRSGALMVMSQSVRPAGYSTETFAGRTAHPLDAARVEALKAFVRTSMQELGVPGAALALVDHGKLVFSGGFGVRELGRSDPVDADTLFAVASNTKGMTTLLLAELVDQGKLRWDEPVTEAYPDFRLGDDATTKKVLIRHLVCACTGLPQRDMESIFNTNRATPASATFAQLAATQPTSGFGEVFQYNNQMVAAAGYVGAHVLHPEMEVGAAYDAAMSADVFGPLGMTRTTVDMSKALAGDHASPHGDDIESRPARVSNDLNQVSIPFRPAAGAWSSANDLIRYVQDELTQGQLADGKRLVSAQNLLMRRAPNVPTGENKHYGMGLEIDTGSGVTVIYHGGSIVGYQTNFLVLPDAQVGAVILTNSDQGQPLIGAFTRRLLEVLYDGHELAGDQVAAAAQAIKSGLAAERQELAIPPAAAAVDALAKAYASPELGHLTVRRTGGEVVFDFGAWKTAVASRKNSDGTTSFVAITPGPLSLGLEFLAAERQGKPALIVRDGQHEYVYLDAG